MGPGSPQLITERRIKEIKFFSSQKKNILSYSNMERVLSVFLDMLIYSILFKELQDYLQSSLSQLEKQTFLIHHCLKGPAWSDRSRIVFTQPSRHTEPTSGEIPPTAVCIMLFWHMCGLQQYSKHSNHGNLQVQRRRKITYNMYFLLASENCSSTLSILLCGWKSSWGHFSNKQNSDQSYNSFAYRVRQNIPQRGCNKNGKMTWSGHVFCHATATVKTNFSNSAQPCRILSLPGAGSCFFLNYAFLLLFPKCFFLLN